jgi:hypothetical protein
MQLFLPPEPTAYQCQQSLLSDAASQIELRYLKMEERNPRRRPLRYHFGALLTILSPFYLLKDAVLPCR